MRTRAEDLAARFTALVTGAESGQTLAEYVMIGALIAAVVFATLAGIGVSLGGLFDRIAGFMNSIV